MQYYFVCTIGVIAGQEDFLTYHSEETLQTGAVIEVPFGKKTKYAVVFRSAPKPKFRTRAVIRALEVTVPPHLLDLAKWISEYYATRLSFVLQTLLPTGIHKKRRILKNNRPSVSREKSLPEMTPEQKKIAQDIQSSSDVTHLLHGVTGSGKTRIYQELAKQVLEQRQSVLVLVPEIALTPQLAAEFELQHSNVLVLHSGMTESERHTHWLTLLNTDEPWVIVGPRSALFSPLKNVGLIIIDEAHEPSYQQDSQPKYNALRVARKLAELSPSEAKLVLGSATPSLADYYIAQHTGSPVHTLTKRVQARNTSVEIIDMRDKTQFSTHNLFSKKLITYLNNALNNDEQVLLFYNRRGTARMVLCADCGWCAECPVCHIPLRLHHDTNLLRCHTCGHKSSPPKVCVSCGGADLTFRGYGSKRIESEVQKLFPEFSVARFDGDTKDSEQLHHRYQDLYDNKIQIIIGTQGIAKGLDLPNLSVVGVIQADSELFIPDYSSSERAFQLTTQVIGRAGRKGQNAHVIIQTLNPEHPAIVHAASEDYQAFYTYELAERRAEHMPPFTFILQATVGYNTAEAAHRAATLLAQKLRKEQTSVFVRGPAPAFHDHRGTQYYQQLVISSASRATLVKIASSLPSRWHFTLDPQNLLS